MSSCFRCLNLQEYQSKHLLSKYGCAVQHFIVADSKEDYVVKAMVLAGGRGKGRFIGGKKDFGGVFITKDRNEALEAVDEMIGKRLVTKQTGADGLLVKKVMIAEGLAIKRETYLAILMDRSFNGPVIVHSPAGGMDIETVAKTKPHLLFKEPIDISVGMTQEQAERVARNLGFEGQATNEIRSLYELFIDVDATQVEINPMVETKDGHAFCIDAKLNFDDSAEYRQKEIFAMEVISLFKSEVAAKKFHLNYIPLDGNIACLVNGAGLAMATMDIIKLYGGNPANFLDVGGAVTEEAVSAAFKIILSDPKVDFCFLDAELCGRHSSKYIWRHRSTFGSTGRYIIFYTFPFICTNVDDGKELLKKSGLPIISVDSLDDAAQKIVSLVKEKHH
uniref:ATP-grasp_2 domain-containing protein n=1 Tax=Syphacia muris TaxID=451379 RepID=A0A0N5AGL8_9BILA